MVWLLFSGTTSHPQSGTPLRCNPRVLSVVISVSDGTPSPSECSEENGDYFIRGRAVSGDIAITCVSQGPGALVTKEVLLVGTSTPAIECTTSESTTRSRQC